MLGVCTGTPWWHLVRRWATRAVLATSLLASSALAVAPQPAAAAVACPPSPSTTPPPTSTPPPAPAALSTGALNLTSTFNSIGIEWKFSGDGNANATAQVQFKKSSDTSWRNGLPLWRTDDGSSAPGPAFYGSLLLLEPGTAYSVRVKVQDPDGVVGQPTGTKTVTKLTSTRAEDIPAASALAPTRFVSKTGQDANDGTSPTTAWASLDKALTSAPAGAVVQVGPGYYTAPPSSTVRTAALTLKAEFPAVDDALNVINPGTHSVIDSGFDTGPANAPEADVAKAPWQQVTFDDPADPSQHYTVWQWANPGLSKVTQLGFASARSAEPKRVAHWTRDTADLATPAGWAKKLYTNKTYNYGFYADSSGLFVRLPGNRNPNALYLTAGAGTGLQLDGANIRVSGFELRQFGQALEYGAMPDYAVQPDHRAKLGVIDHNQLVGNLAAIVFSTPDGAPPPAQDAYGAGHVVQYNRITDTNLWTADNVNNPGIPWTFIKQCITNADGSPYPTRRLGGRSESLAVQGQRGGAQQVVIRHNLIDGTFNGVMPNFGAGFDRYTAQDMDVHDNVMRHVSDDALEPEGSIINMRAWNNRFKETSVILSIAPLAYGPVYLFRNEGWCLGSHGVPKDASGQLTYGGSGKSPLIKYSGVSNPTGYVYVVHNTFSTDPGCWLPDSPPQVLGGARFATDGPSKEYLYLRNNIIHVTNFVFDVADVTRWNEDYNHLSTSDPARGLRACFLATKTCETYTNIDAYRAKTGQGLHSNIDGDLHTAPALVNPLNGNLALPVGSLLIDAGTEIANISDRPGVDFHGAHPDVGARER